MKVKQTEKYHNKPKGGANVELCYLCGENKKGKNQDSNPFTLNNQVTLIKIQMITIMRRPHNPSCRALVKISILQ